MSSEMFSVVELTLKKMKKNIDKVSIDNDSLLFKKDRSTRVRIKYKPIGEPDLVPSFNMVVMSYRDEMYANGVKNGFIKTYLAGRTYKSILKTLEKKINNKNNNDFVSFAEKALIDPIEDIVLANDEDQL